MAICGGKKTHKVRRKKMKLDNMPVCTGKKAEQRPIPVEEPGSQCGLPATFQLADDLFGQTAHRFVGGGGLRLPRFGEEVGGLAGVNE